MKVKNSHIDAVLDRGRYLGSNLLWLVIAVIGVYLVLLVMAVAVVAVYLNADMAEIIGFAIGLLCTGAVFIAPSVWLLIKNEKIKRLINKSLADPEAVVLAAYAKDYDNSGAADRTKSGTKIIVEFNYNGEKFTRYSGQYGKTTLKNGYDKVFNKYVNRDILILYSPECNQVLLIKEQFYSLYK